PVMLITPADRERWAAAMAESIRVACDQLVGIERRHVEALRAGRNDEAQVDRQAAIESLGMVSILLMAYGRSRSRVVLDRLRNALIAVAAGARAPAMLVPRKKPSSRRSDPALLWEVRASLAVAVYERQLATGDPLRLAVAWVCRKVPRALARRLS